MRLRAPALAALLLALVLVVYGRVLSFGFLDLYDDALYVTGNAHVRAGLSWEGATWAFRSVGFASNWHPLTWLSHMLDVQLFGLAPGGHHLTSLLLHFANALALGLVFARLTGCAWRSALLAALFAVHPLQVESVAWVAERKNLLSTLFWILSVAAYLRYARRPGAGTYLAVLAALSLGLLAKPMLVTLPLVFLLLDWWPLGRFRPAAGAPSRLLREKIPFFLVAAASATVTLLAQARGGALVPLGDLPLPLRVSNAIGSLGAYVARSLWPFELSAFYPAERSPLLSGKVLGLAALLALATALALRARRRRPSLALGWLWYLCSLLPVIGLIQVGGQASADRYMYVPLVGLLVALLWALPERRRAVALLAAAAVVPVLAAGAHRQTGFWADEELLFGQALRAAPGNWLAETNLGAVKDRRGREAEAFAHFARALELEPRFPKGHYNLAVLLGRRGELEEAAAHYREALRLRPEYGEAHCNLGLLLLRQGKAQEAISHLREALRVNPGDEIARRGLAHALRAGR